MDGLIDTHCHLNFYTLLEDLSEVLKRAQKAGVFRILIPGTDLETSQQAVKLSQSHPFLFAAVGIHPNDATKWNGDSLHVLRTLAKHPKVVAIGEIGLDYYRRKAPQHLQKEVFQSQLKLAAELELPVIVHNRQATEDILKMLIMWQEELTDKKSPIALRPGVWHSFSGNFQAAMPAIQKGFYLGISGPITYHNALEHQNVIARLPLESLLLETDAPFLAPHPFRGKRNEPAYLAIIAEKLATLHHTTPSEIAKATTRNAEQLFAWRTSN
ncbi:MAG: TatD family hydrolase [Anaerolineales bacterium]